MKFGTKNFYVHHLQKEWCSYKYVMKLCADTSQVDDKVYYFLVRERCDPAGDSWSAEERHKGYVRQ